MSFFFGKFKAVIFDLDGVIIDSEPIHLEVLNEICIQWGNPYTADDYAQYLGKTYKEIWSMVKKRYNVDFDVEEMVRFYNRRLTEYFKNADRLPIVKGIPELLSVLKQEGILCAIGSASSRVNIDLTLEHIKNRDCFCVVVSGDDAVNGKPAPDIYLTAAEKMGIEPKDCAVIEDTTPGILAALRAGMYCIAYANVTSGKQDYSGANKIILSMYDIIADGSDGALNNK